MLSRLFLIPTLLLIGITTVVIGAPVAETIEIIKAVEIRNMGSSNLTLNRRFFEGIPGLPQCPDPAHPDLMSSRCLDAKTIEATCAVLRNPDDSTVSVTNCLEKHTCMDFRGGSAVNAFATFAICIYDDLIKKFEDRDKDGVVCKSFQYIINSSSGTLSIGVYDYRQRPFQVQEISITMNNQYRSMSNTYNYSTIIDGNDVKKVEVCLDYGSKTPFIGMISLLDGTYG
ncbi:hypothetical protein Glove_700g22 [Diversispora epigaea]|uniref:SUEL-type lectin domain-containing protein n=1 Tax=Diversispora epigaea TaxID=1348612 RepID=A0A397G313_9GLOM|nr:hypothetical protein Glove_700g22 [Diversispora epigaea]